MQHRLLETVVVASADFRPQIGIGNWAERRVVDEQLRQCRRLEAGAVSALSLVSVHRNDKRRRDRQVECGPKESSLS